MVDANKIYELIDQNPRKALELADQFLILELSPQERDTINWAKGYLFLLKSGSHQTLDVS